MSERAWNQRVAVYGDDRPADLKAYGKPGYAEHARTFDLMQRILNKPCRGGECDTCCEEHGTKPCKRHKDLWEIVERYKRRYWK